MRSSRSSGTLRATVNSRPSCGPRPILDAFSTAAEVCGDAAESSNVGLRFVREAQLLSLDEENASPGGPAKWMKKLAETAGAPAEIRE